MQIRVITKFCLITVSLAFLTLNLLGQKCNYEKNEIDGLLEVPIKRTGPQKLCRINNQPVYVKAQCIGDNKYLKIMYYKYDGFHIQEDREISFILPSNDEIILFPREMPVDSTKVDDLTDLSSLLIYKLSAEQYQILKDVPVVKFKYFIVSGFIEKEIKAGNQANVMQVLRCVE